MPTLKDVASLAGVSIAAVSLYANGKSQGRVSPETQRKIAQAIEETGYVIADHKVHENSAEPRTTKTIAIFWSIDFKRNLLGACMGGIQTAIVESGLADEDYDFIIRPYESDQLYKQKRYLCSRQYHAALIFNLSMMDMQYLQSIVPQIPIVLINRLMKQYHCVFIDSAKIGDQAAELIHEKGYSSLCTVGYQSSRYLAINSRHTEFINACRTKKIEIPNEFQLYTDNSIEGGIAAAKEYLSYSNRPNMIFAATDSIAFGIAKHFHEAGIRIPEDCGLFCYGFERAELTEYAIPPISSIDISTFRLGKSGMELILEILNKGISMPQHIDFPCSISLRDSF